MINTKVESLQEENKQQYGKSDEMMENISKSIEIKELSCNKLTEMSKNLEIAQEIVEDIYSNNILMLSEQETTGNTTDRDTKVANIQNRIDELKTKLSNIMNTNLQFDQDIIKTYSK